MSQPTMVAYREASDSQRFRKDFSELPDRVRTGQSRVGLIPAPLWNRFLDVASEESSEFWLLYLRDTPLARVGASVLTSHPDTGAIGFFEIDTTQPDVQSLAEEIIRRAEHWLHAQCIRKVVGPMNLNTWFPYRFRTDLDQKAFSWEPNNPEAYPTLFSSLGYQPCEEYHSVGSEGLQALMDKTEQHFRQCVDHGFNFRPFDSADVLTREVPILHQISMVGFKDNFLFEPIRLELFRELYVPMAKKLDFSHSFFAISPARKEVGFLFCFVDAEYLVLKSTTVHPDFRGLGLSNALIHLAAKRGAERGISKYVSALMRSGSQSESYSKKGETLWVHQYVLFQKLL